MQTVSRVANGLENVHPLTKQRVEQAMRTLGYRPNLAARALRSGRFKSIGVIVFTFSSYGNVRTIEAITAAAAAAGYSVTLMAAARRTDLEVADAFVRLQEQAVDGVILLIETHILHESDIVLPEGLPVVFVDASPRPDHPLVDTDQSQGARLATEHLLELGHETVWHISGPAGSHSAELREAAWRETLEGAGRTVPPVFRGDWTTHSGYPIGRRIAARPDITAVFASNDQMALGLLRACHEAGRPVPASISVVGFDDMQAADSFWPPLTTVHQHFDAVGRTSIRLLLAAIDGDTGAPRVAEPTRLVIRQTTAPPPAPSHAPTSG